MRPDCLPEIRFLAAEVILLLLLYLEVEQLLSNGEQLVDIFEDGVARETIAKIKVEEP